MKQWIVPALAALAAGWLAWTLKPTPPPTYRDVVVPDKAIEREAPKPELKVIERIRWHVAEPTVIARGDTPIPARLEAYCAPLTNSAPADTSLVVAPVLPPSSGKYTGKVLSLFSVTSDGRLFAQETQVRAPFQWVNRDGVYEVREERAPFRLLHGLPGTLLKVGAGVGLGIIIAK